MVFKLFLRKGCSLVHHRLKMTRLKGSLCHSEFQLLLYSPPFMFIVHDATDLIPIFGVRLPRNGREIALALSTTSWYFLIFCSRPRLLFSSVGAENHNRLHWTTQGTFIL